MFQKLSNQEAHLILQTALESSEALPEEKKEAFDFLELAQEAMTIFLREAQNPKWQGLTLEDRKQIVQRIKNAPQIPQRSEEWYKHYSKVLTASEFSALFTMNKRRKDMVYNKARPDKEVTTNYRTACPTEEMNALGWGIRFEPVVKQLLEHRDKCLIFEPGRLNHPTNTHLAASPDGVIESANTIEHVGRLIEIKCPYSRTIGGEIPSEYWIQMQIQMEVTDIDECEYIECDFVSKRAKQTTPLDLSECAYQGFIYLFKQIVDDDQPFEYKYMYGGVGEAEEIPVLEGYECLEVIPWGLKSWHRKIVHRDRAWYEGTKPWQETFWNDVEFVRQGKELVLNSTPKPSACLITDD